MLDVDHFNRSTTGMVIRSEIRCWSTWRGCCANARVAAILLRAMVARNLRYCCRRPAWHRRDRWVETLRAIVASRPLVTAAGEQIAVTVSIGIACFPDTRSIMSNACCITLTVRCTRPRESGRNRVVCANRGRDEDNQPQP